MLKRCCPRFFSTFETNMSTSSPPHGPPRGFVNRYVSMGLPPWAAYSNNNSRRAIYQLTNPHPGVYPCAPHKLKEIWMYERIRVRVRASRTYNHIFKQLKHPQMEIGVWYSDILDHWIQIPHVMAAKYVIEKRGGIDNFILGTNGEELKSTYGEKLRRNLLVRKKEIEKNFVLQKQAEALAEQMYAEYKASPDEAKKKYGFSYTAKQGKVT
eukprot:PhF_6_TR4286/c0_g1_i1/m.5787